MSSINTPLLFAVLATAVSAYSPSMTPEQKALLYDSYYQNHRIQWYLGYVWAATVAAIFTYRITVTGLRYVRTLACLENEKQHYFVNPHPGWAALRRNIIDAPLFRRRHNREFKLSAAASMGTLPGRLQTMYLIGPSLICMCRLNDRFTNCRSRLPCNEHCLLRCQYPLGRRQRCH